MITPIFNPNFLGKLLNNTFIKLLFFGNYFYGICAVCLSTEALLQQNIPLNDSLFFAGVFFATVLYYSKAYIATETVNDKLNLRALWYIENKNAIRHSLIFYQWLIACCLIYILIQYYSSILYLTILELFLLVLFPLISILYYGFNNKSLEKFNLRTIGWLKPFIIGFTWAGIVTVFPVIYYKLTHGWHYHLTWVGSFLFIKNFMFITVLSIMFDIKDYAMDYNVKLKTFAVRIGLRKTILFIIVPLCVIGLASFISYAIVNQFQPMKIGLNIIPFVLTIAVAYSLFYRKNILYYLIIIDGLMLIKAFCGIVAMKYF